MILKSLTGGGGGAPIDATYITQTTNATLTNEQALASLATGVLSSTTATGVVASTTFTAGSIPFGAASILAQNNTRLFWDNTFEVLMVGSASTLGRVSQRIEQHQAAAGGGIGLFCWQNSATAAPTLDFNVSRSGTTGVQGIVANGDTLGGLYFRGSDGGSLRFAAAIESFVDATTGVGDMPGRLTFSTTADGAATSTERMRITNAGNVGIGTTFATPDTLGNLDVTGNGNGIRHIGYATQGRIVGARGDGTQGSPTALVSGDLIAQFAADGYFNTTTLTTGADILVYAAANWSATTVASSRMIFRVHDGSTTLIQRLTLLPSGVFIVGGTTNTAYGRLGQLLETDTSANYGGMAINCWSTNTGQGGILDFNTSRSATIGTHTIVASGGQLGGIAWRGSDGSAFQNAAAIEGFVDTTSGVNDMPGRLVFSTTADGSTSLTERMRIDSAGRFMFGVTSVQSSQFISIKQPATAQGIALQSSADDSVLLLQHVTATTEFRLSSTYNTTGSYQPLSFWTSDVKRLDIKAAGNIVHNPGTTFTSGTVFSIAYPGAMTAAGQIIGLDVDLNTNVTGNSQNFTGVYVRIPTGAGSASPAFRADLRNTAGYATTNGAFEVLYAAATTLTGQTVGYECDLSTNVTPGANAIIGARYVIPATTRADTALEAAGIVISSTATRMRMIDCAVANTGATTGLWVLRWGTATTLSATTYGITIDGTTNVTPGAQNLTLINLSTAAAFVSNTTQGAILVTNTGGGNSVTVVNTSDSQGMYFTNNYTSAITSSMFIQQRTGTVSGGTENRPMVLTNWAPSVNNNMTYLPNSAMVNVLFNPDVSAGTLTVTGAIISQVNYAPTTSGGSVSGLVVGFKIAVTPPNSSACRGMDIVMGSNSSGAAINVTGNGTGPLFLGVDTSTTVYTLYDGGGLELGSGTTTPGASRLKLSGGTATATTDWAASAGWGASATVSAVSGNDSRGTVTVTTNAADTPTAGPTITLTFKDGTWTTAPFAVSCMVSSSTGPTTIPVSITTSATTLVIKYNGTPTATSALTYIFSYHVLG